MPVSESAIQHHIQLALSEAGHTVFRANVGKAWTGNEIIKATRLQPIVMRPGDVLIRNARPFDTGLPVGFSDLFGFTFNLKPFFHEVKSESGRLSAEQQRFLEAMRQRGAIAEVVRSVDAALKCCE